LGATRKPKRAYLTPQNAPDGFECIRLVIPRGGEWSDLARGALVTLLQPYYWEKFGIDIDDTLDYWGEALQETFKWERCMPIGTILMWAGQLADIPDGWMPCLGQPLDQADYPELFAVIGTTYGAGGVDQFQLPSFVRRFPFGYGIPDFPGSTGGVENVTLTVDQMPAHSHEVDNHDHSIPGLLTAPIQTGAGVAYAPNPIPGSTGGASPDTNSQGGGQSHTNMPPYTAVTFMIRYK
jgi:microcystin-dependent protein